MLVLGKGGELGSIYIGGDGSGGGLLKGIDLLAPAVIKRCKRRYLETCLCLLGQRQTFRLSTSMFWCFEKCEYLGRGFVSVGSC